MTTEKSKTLQNLPDSAPVIVGAARTPFLKSHGAFRELMAHDLGRLALSGLLARSPVSAADVGLVVLGNVVQDPRTTNVAREAALGAALPLSTPALTVTLACISANVALTTVADRVRLGELELGIAGGTESFSDPPIRVSRGFRRALVRLQKAKGPKDWLAILQDLAPSDVLPDVPEPVEHTTGLSMGQSCERMIRRIRVSREESDAYALRSHHLAAQAWRDGHYDDVVPVVLPEALDPLRKQLVRDDDGPRGDSTLASLSQLRPAFDPDFGILTAGSSSFLSDGASAMLVASAKKARALGIHDAVHVVDSVLVACDPLEELLLGPSLAIPKLLRRSGLRAEQVSVYEIHEAFAAQLVACLKALDDKVFLKERVGVDGGIGKIAPEKVNAWGGSLALGHPFGATGGRLVSTAMKRLRAEGARYAVVAGCAAGGHGSAILLENLSS